MNERIKELYGQAALFVFENKVGVEGPKETLQEAISEKFAELIVRECIKCCDDLERTNQYYISKFGFDPEIRPKQCIQEIKEHFGVE